VQVQQAARRRDVEDGRLDDLGARDCDDIRPFVAYPGGALGAVDVVDFQNRNSGPRKYLPAAPEDAQGLVVDALQVAAEQEALLDLARYCSGAL
jgi:hypothetical protein